MPLIGTRHYVNSPTRYYVDSPNPKYRGLRIERLPFQAVCLGILLFDDATLISMFFGLDYSYNKECFVYFNLLYKIVELGIKEKMSDIDMGITTLVPKKDIGAYTTTLNMYMKHFNPLLNKIVPKAFNVMTPQDGEGPRRVFKADSESL